RAAGFVFRDARENHPTASRFAVGVDCSGFVSRCWGLEYHCSTWGLEERSRPLASHRDLLPGDILNKPGAHVVLFKAFVDRGRSRISVFEAGECKVVESQYAVADLLKNGFVPRRDARRPM